MLIEQCEQMENTAGSSGKTHIEPACVKHLRPSRGRDHPFLNWCAETTTATLFYDLNQVVFMFPKVKSSSRVGALLPGFLPISESTIFIHSHGPASCAACCSSPFGPGLRSSQVCSRWLFGDTGLGAAAWALQTLGKLYK